MLWRITNKNAGTIAVGNGQPFVDFFGIENVTGGPQDDTFAIANAGRITIVGGGGNDAVEAPNTPNTWDVDTNGNLNGRVSFSNVGTLVGGSGVDIFNVDVLSTFTGEIEGGDGAVTDQLNFTATALPATSSTMTFTGPGAGSVTREVFAPTTITYSGIERISDVSPVSTRVLRFSDGPDSVRVDQSATVGSIWVQPLSVGAFATAELTNPLVALQIQALGGSDTVMVDSFSPGFTATVSIDGGDGNDSLLVALPTALAAGVTVDGGNGIDSLVDLTLIPAAQVSNVEILPTGIPTFTEQGPGPILASSVVAPASAPLAGAVQSLAVDPFDDQILFAGTVNGGVWRSTNGGASWTALTDALPTLAISALTIAPRDADGALLDAGTAVDKLVLYAGTGSFSSLSGSGGIGVGLIRSFDGGETWSVLAVSTLATLRIAAVVALDQGSNAEFEDRDHQTVLVAGDGGLFRSTDSGVTFTKSTGVTGTVTDLVADPGAPGRVYAAVVGAGAGIYRSDNGGFSWTPVSTQGLDLTANRIVLAVNRAADSLVNPVYAALLSGPAGIYLTGVFVSTPGDGGSANGPWSLLGAPGVLAPPRPTASMSGRPTLTFGAGGTIDRSTGNWLADGFSVGQSITIAAAATATNNGTWVVTAVTQTRLTVQATLTGAPDAVATVTATALSPGITVAQQPQVDLTSSGRNLFALTADGAGNVYIAGDRLVGTLGILYVFTPKTSAGAVSNAWTQLDGASGGTRPHSDSRDLVLDAAGRAGSDGATAGALLDATDSGIYKLALAAGTWSSLNGATGGSALDDVEVVSAAYDPLNDIIFMGAQDTGTATQGIGASDSRDGNLDGLIDDPVERLPWLALRTGDGNTVVSVPVFGQNGIVSEVHITLGNNLSLLSKTTYDASDSIVPNSQWTPALALAGPRSLTAQLGGDLTTFTATSAAGLLLTDGAGPFQLTGGTLPTGASPNAVYYVRLTGGATFVLTDGAGNQVTFTGPGDATLVVQKLVDLQATLGADNTEFTTAGVNGLVDGDGPFVLRGTLPTGATQTSTYSVHVIDSRRFELTSNGTPVQFSNSAGITVIVVRRYSGLVAADAKDFTSGYEPGIQYVANAVAPNLMVLALHAVYTSVNTFDQLKVLPLENDNLQASALAAGGVIDGVAQPNVLYVAWGNTIEEILPSATSSTGWAVLTEQIAGARVVSDIVLDPSDARTAYAVTNIGVFKRALNTQTGRYGWTSITGNLPTVGLDTAAYIPKSQLQWAPGTAEADKSDVLLVGGTVGIFRAFDPGPGAVWTEVGSNLPNALVSELSYTQIDPGAFVSRRPIASGGILLAATLGRGAWTLEGADVALAQQPILTLNGTDGNDTFELARDAQNPANLDVTVDGVTWTSSIASILQIVISGGAGDDTLVVDSSLGAISLPNGIRFTGGDGIDSVTLEGQFTQSFSLSGTTPRLASVTTLGGTTERVTFADYLPGTDDDFSTSGLGAPTSAQSLADAIAAWAGLTKPPAPQLAVLGGTLPTLFSGQDASGQELDADAVDGPAAPAPGETSPTSAGLDRLFTFDDGSTLESLISDGAITDTASLVAQLQRLVGADGTVVLTGTEAEPQIELTFSKTLSGAGNFDVGFDQLGGHVALSGNLNASADVHVHLIVGVDSNGVYFQTGFGPQLSIDNIQVQGNLDGSGSSASSASTCRARRSRSTVSASRSP